jgi:hypothetical protein
LIVFTAEVIDSSGKTHSLNISICPFILLNLPMMSDNLKKSGRGDEQRINLVQDFEIRYWTEQLKISEAVLRTAVAAVGPVVADVKKWLKQRGY